MNQTEASIWNRALSRCGDYRLTFSSAKSVASATAANPVVCTSTAHGLADGDLVVLTQFSQMTQINGRVFRAENPTANTFELADENGLLYTAESSGGTARKLTAASNKQAKALFDAWPPARAEVLRAHPWNAAVGRDRLARLQAPQAITGASATNPVVISSAAHGYSSGDTIRLQNLGGMVELNDLFFTVATVATNTYELSGIDGLLYTAYTGGGTSRKALTPLRPDFDYTCQYDLPADCVRLLELAEEEESDWEVSGRRVYTDIGITVPIRYMRLLKDVTLYDPMMASAMAAKLAWEISRELADSNSLRQSLSESYASILQEARGVDAQEHSVSPVAEDDWERARR